MPSLKYCTCTASTAMRHIIYEMVGADYRKCRLTYWLNRRLYPVPTVHGILFQQPHVSPPLRCLKYFLGSPLFILLAFLLCVMPWQFATAQTSPLFPCSLTDIDEDDDGLIDICDLEGLDAIRYQPDGTGYKASESAEKITAGCPNNRCGGYELMRDLDFLDPNSYRSGIPRQTWVSGSGWQPMGSFSLIFRSTLKGNGYAIRNLMINRTGRDEVGLFAVNSGIIRDIRLLDVNIQGRSRVGALVGWNNRGLIINSHVSGSMRGSSWVGALTGIHGNLGNHTLLIENSSATGMVLAIGDQIGGLVGQNTSAIRNSQAFNTVSGANRVGGLVGSSSETRRNMSSITNSYATGSVMGNTQIGGLVGHAGFFTSGEGARISNSYATGRVEGETQVGGLAGSASQAQIENSFAHGEVIGTGTDGHVGGLVGELSDRSWIESSHTTGDVTGHSQVGGLVGSVVTGSINRSYTTGNVAGITDVGGFSGLCRVATITNSHAIGDVRGDLRVGGFIGESGSNGRITNNYASGNVRGGEGSNKVGGFIGESVLGRITSNHAIGDVRGGQRVGGFIGHNLAESRISNSYAIGNVQGDQKVGGFIGANGENEQGFVWGGGISDSYASGDVRGRQEIGGFAGRVFQGSITNSYASGDVQGNQEVGGFIGDRQGARITNSYWDESTSGRTDSAGGEGKTTVELQTPIEAGSTPTDIYYDWDEQVWDFGTPAQYPALKYSDGTLQPHQRLGLFRLGLASGLILSPSFKSEVLSYRIIDETDIRRIRLTPVAANPNAEIIIESGGDFRAQVLSGTTSTEISLNTIGVTMVTVEVRTPHNTPTQYTLAFNDRTFNEGERIVLERAPKHGTDESALRYKWTQISGTPRLLPMEGISQAVLDIAIPNASLGKTEDDSDIAIRLEINNGTVIETKDLRLTIIKVDNGTVMQAGSVITRSDRTLTAPETDLSTDPDGVGMINNYLWQMRTDRNVDWIDIESTTANIYRVPEAVAPYTEYRVQYGYTDGQGYIQTLISEVLVFVTNIDTDNNGLIEINDLEGLDVIRYQLDGSGYRQNETADKITTGCPNEGCKGYELTRSLDFRQGASYRSGIIRAAWTTGSGWLPIGTSEAPFDAILNANGHTIANLGIDRSNAARGVGLFGVTASNAKIENVGLLGVNILGNQGVGGLVGYKRGGSIINSYVTGQVRGGGDYDVGGLVGWHRGGTISNSHSSSTVVGSRLQVGGLVGDNDGGTITDSYARGSVSGHERVGGLAGRNSKTGIIMRGRAEVKVNGDARVGGLVGENSGIITNSYTRERIAGIVGVGGFVGWNSGAITNSYALGFVRGNNEVGGFIGDNLGGTITNSYARGDVSGANRYIGGLVGWSARGAIINSYAQGDVDGKDGVGGLVGVNLGLTNNQNIGRVSKSYAAGHVRGDRNSGGLIGENRDGHVEKSYWNKTNNPTVVSAGGTSKTSVEMRTPTQPGNNTTEIYYDWNTADWDFGGTDQYPTLRYAMGPQSPPACNTVGNPSCRTPLAGQRQTERIAASIEPISDIRLLTGVVRELNVVFSVGVSDDPVKFRTSVRSSNPNIATVSIPERGDLIRTLRIETGSDIGRSEITVLVDDGEGLDDSISSTTFVVTTKVSSAPRITITSPPESILVGERIVITIGVMDVDFDVGDRVVLEAMSSSRSIVSVMPAKIDTIAIDTIITFTLTGVKAGIATVVFTVTDSKGLSNSETVSVLVDERPTGSVSIDANNKWLLTSMIENVNDMAEVSYQWYREDATIASATSPTYMIPDNRIGRAAGTSYSFQLTIVNDMGQSTVVQSDPYRVVNEPPVITSITAVEMISEGDTQNISVTASDANYDGLMYRWSGDLEILSNENSNPAILSIPPYYIKDATATQITLNLVVDVDDGGLSASATVLMVVNKKNNGSATLGTSIEIGSRERTLTAIVLSEDPDGGTSGSVVYQWQVCAGNQEGCPSANDWMNIDMANGTQYIISGTDILLENGSSFTVEEDKSIFRVRGTYTDRQGSGERVYSVGYSYGRLNASPTMSGLPAERIRLLEGAETEFDVVLNDVDVDDISSNLVFGIQSDKSEVAKIHVEGEGTTRTIKITGVGGGIATITATVNDGRGVSNSEVLEQFEVEVEGNEAPVLKITSAAQPTIGLGNTTQVTVLVSDSNFDVDDSVVLEAISSSQSIVSVIPEKTDFIATDTGVIFTLTGVKAGIATIVFIAMDSRGSTNSVSLLVSVDVQPTGSVHIELDSSDKWLLRVTSTIEDANDIVEINYQWYRNGVAIPNATSPTYTIPDNRLGRATGASYSVELTVIDGIGQSVVIQSNSYRVVSEPPVITSISVPEVINEGDTQAISVSASDTNYDDLMYRWGGDSEVLSNKNSNPARLGIPSYYIKDSKATQTTLNLVVEVSDGELSTTRTVSVVVNKRNNDSARLGTLLDFINGDAAITAIVSVDDPDGGISEAEYQWQVCAGDEGPCFGDTWMNIDEATEAQYIISGSSILVEGGNRFHIVQSGSVFRALLTYIDSQGYSAVIDSVSYTHRLRVNNSPTISGTPSEQIRLLERAETEFVVELSDADADDISSNLAFSIQSYKPEVAEVSAKGEGTTRTIKITGVGAGITTVTATVNDGRSVSNSEVSKRFKVEVEGNEAPVLKITSVAQPTIGLGSAIQVMVLVSDNNFDVGDSVVLEAMSSSRSIVSVIPTRTDAITTDASITFALAGVKAGIATVVFTATDSRGSTNNISLLVLVDAKPIGSVRIEPDSSDKWLLRATSMIEDADDIVEMNYQWYREGVAIAGATSQTYMIPDNREGRATGTAYRLELIIVDDLRRMIVIQSNPYMIANEPPIIIVSAAQTISEGDTQDISVQASDLNYDDLMYRWSGDSRVLSDGNSNPATLSIPADYIKDAASTQTALDLEVEVYDGDFSTTGTVSVVVEKQNNGSAILGITKRGTTLTAMILSGDPDGGTSWTVVYQWQVCAGNEGRCPSANDWMDIDGATEERYMISAADILVEGGSTFSLVEGGSIFRVGGTYTDAQGYREEVYSPKRVYAMVLKIRVKVFLEGPLQ